MRRTTAGSEPLVVAVTGASGGVGRATAIEFGRRGCSVALIARGSSGLQGAAGEVRAVGGRTLVVPLDVTDAAGLDDAVNLIEKTFGAIDVWVNAAFSAVFAPFHEITPYEYRRATEVTYLGYVYATMAVLKRMRQRDRGSIVHVGSALAYRGIPLQSAYCGAKHAIQGFSESLRCELMHEQSGVRTTMVQLPALNTPQFSWLLSRLPKQAQPVPPIYQPEVAARAIVYAARHPDRREYWVGRSTVKSMIANAIVPGVLDRYLARVGYSSQQTDKDRPPDQPANLWHPADATRDFGTHGIFDDRAIPTSVQAGLSRRRNGIIGAGLALGAGLAMLRSRAFRNARA
jgi:NAD(P)-dependent dehydrogenase (short-subunit alcohol dehydrogenase family)